MATRVRINNGPGNVTLNEPAEPSTIRIGPDVIPPVLTPSVGVIIGDSTSASYLSQHEIGFYLFTPDEITAGYGYENIAVAGRSIQTSRQFDWTPLADKTSYQWVIMRIGVNDLNPAETAAVALNRFQIYVDLIKTDVPDIKIITCKFIPWYSRLETLYAGDAATAQQKKEDMEEAIMGLGPNAITDIDGTIDFYAEENDGTNNLITTPVTYRSSDGFHNNNAEREFAASYYRQSLIQFGW